MDVFLTNKLKGFVNQHVEEAYDCSAIELVRERLRLLEIRKVHGQRDPDDDRLSNLINADIISKSYEYLIRKFAEHNEIAEVLRTTEQKTKLAQSKKVALKDLFRTLLNELMCAKSG